MAVRNCYGGELAVNACRIEALIMKCRHTTTASLSTETKRYRFGYLLEHNHRSMLPSCLIGTYPYISLLHSD